MIFMGIDPGLNKTGVGIIFGEKDKISYISHKLITTNPKGSLPERIGEIVAVMNEIINEYKPQYAGIENIFHSINVKSALLLGQTRGALIATMTAHNIPVREFTALQIKKALTGHGKAEKEQVKKMVEIHLNMVFKEIPLDITDALACGLCLAYYQIRENPF